MERFSCYCLIGRMEWNGRTRGEGVDVILEESLKIKIDQFIGHVFSKTDRWQNLTPWPITRRVWPAPWFLQVHSMIIETVKISRENLQIVSLQTGFYFPQDVICLAQYRSIALSQSVLRCGQTCVRTMLVALPGHCLTLITSETRLWVPYLCRARLWCSLCLS